MRLSTLCAAMALAVGSIGLAYATPLVTNGDFSTTAPTVTAPTQFSPGSGAGNGCNGGGQFVSGWTGGHGYQLWYPGTYTSGTKNESTQYGCANTQRLPDGTDATAQVTAPPKGGPAFVGLDGQSGIQGAIWQTIDGLTNGKKYVVTFDWATTQEISRNGATWDYLQVDLANAAQPMGDGTTATSQVTATNWIMQHGFSGWASDSLTFVANGTSQVLSFLSVGGELLCDGKVFGGTLASCTNAGGTLAQMSFSASSGLPPFALLANVDISELSVPEPPVLAIFGLGLLGLGAVAEVARRRARRRTADDGALA